MRTSRITRVPPAERGSCRLHRPFRDGRRPLCLRLAPACESAALSATMFLALAGERVSRYTDQVSPTGETAPSELAPPRRRTTLTVSRASGRALPTPTVFAAEATTTANASGAAWASEAPRRATGPRNAQHSAPAQAELEFQVHSAPTHGDAGVSVPRITDISKHCITAVPPDERRPGLAPPSVPRPRATH